MRLLSQNISTGWYCFFFVIKKCQTNRTRSTLRLEVVEKKISLSFPEHVTYPYLSLIESHNKSVWKNQIVKIHGTLNEVLQTYNIIIGIKLLHNPLG